MSGGVIDSVSDPDRQTRPSGWMESRPVQPAFWLAFYGYAGLIFLCLFGIAVGEFDEPLQLVGAMLVSHGLTPSVDFYSVYTPLGSYVNAFAFGLLGRNVLTARLVNAVLYVSLLFLANRFLRRKFADSKALVPLATLLFVTGIGGGLVSPSWQGIAFSQVGFLIYADGENPAHAGKDRLTRQLFRVAVSGAVTGIAMLYRMNFGVYTAAAVGIGLLLRGEAKDGRWRFAPDLKALAAFGITLAGCFWGFYFWVYGAGAITVLRQLVVAGGHAIGVRFITLEPGAGLILGVVFPAVWFFARILLDRDGRPLRALVPAAFALALPAMALAGGQHAAIPYLIVAAELASVTVLHLLVRRLDESEFAILLFYCCYLHYYLSRADGPHRSVLPFVIVLLLPFLVLPTGNGELPTSRRSAAAPLKPVPRVAALAFLIVAILSMATRTSSGLGMAAARTGFRVLKLAWSIQGQSESELVADSVISPTPEWEALYPDREELEAVRYLRGRTGSRDPIVVASRDHSRIYTTDMRIYWLADRPIGVRTFQMETGWATEADVQREIIADLERNRVKWMVMDMAEQHGDRTFERRAYRGSTLLDEYVRDHFQQDARFGRFAIVTAR